MALLNSREAIMEKEYLEQDIGEVDLELLVKDALDEALINEEGRNVGMHENHCDKNIKEYYIALKNGEEAALKRQEELIEEFKNEQSF